MWTCISVLMYVNILSRTWRGVTGTCTRGHTAVHICKQLFKRGGADTSQVDMPTCTDACTHSYWPFFIEKKRELSIVDYIKKAPVY